MYLNNISANGFKIINYYRPLWTLKNVWTTGTNVIEPILIERSIIVSQW